MSRTDFMRRAKVDLERLLLALLMGDRPASVAKGEVQSILREPAEEVLTEEEAFANSTEPELPESGELTMEIIATWHAAILHRQLQWLEWGNSPAVQREVLEWIFDGPQKEIKRSNGEKAVVDAVDIPFSFDMCCRFEELDPDRLRAALKGRLEAMGVTKQAKSKSLH